MAKRAKVPAKKKATPPRTERERDAARKRTKRGQAKTVKIPKCADPRRRKRLEADDAVWLRWYFHETFWYDFTGQQLAMIDAIHRKIRQGGDQAIAASRGEGKSTLAERLALKYVLQGLLQFVLLLHSTGGKAADSLAEIKEAIEINDRLAADYPEVCTPVRALEQTPNRAHYQLVTGKRHDTGKAYPASSSKFSWCGQEVYFPDVPGSPSARAIIATRGLDAEVRGIKKKGRRPGLIIIDDPDTEQTVSNEEQAEKLEKRIDRGLAFAGGQQKAVARVMLTTIQRKSCPSAKYTDPQQKPSWQGKRFRFLMVRPDRTELWDEYISLRIQGQINGDEHSRIAHQFYLDRRVEMDAGAVVANPHRFDPTLLPDGSQVEVSSLERYFNEVARVGQDAVSTEWDNDPPDESGPQESGITAHRIQHQVSGFPRKQVPPGCVKLTQGIDVHKQLLYYVVKAWREDCTGYVIDYDVQETHGTTVGTDEGLDNAIRKALESRHDWVLENPYTGQDGRIFPLDLTCIDYGYRSEAVAKFCRESGLSFKPCKGFGKSAGCAAPNFVAPVKSSADKKVGDHWFLARQQRGLWLCCVDTDYWKAWEHDRWMTAPDKPGTVLLYGERSEVPGRDSADEKRHFTYAKHLTAEIEIEEVDKHKRLVRCFRSKSDLNHYYDASVLADVAASMAGIRLTGKAPPPAPVQAGEWFK